MTKTYIGTKEVLAWPQDKVVGDGSLSAIGYAVRYAEVYTSWSPKDVFEAAHRATEGDDQALNFGDAVYFLKAGRAVARKGWNGKGMWLQLVTNWDGDICHLGPGGKLLPWIGMKTADNGFVPWLASQTDMLAEDWMVLPL